MKKILLLSLLALLLIPSILAINVTIPGEDDRVVLISGMDKPTTFDLVLTNNGNSNKFMVYNLLGFEMSPRKTEVIKKGETKTTEVTVTAPEGFEHNGYYTFDYFIRASDDTEVARKLVLKFISPESAFTIGADSFDPESSSIEIFIKNKENFDFGEISAKFSSAFFNLEETFSIGPNEKKDFTINLNKEDYAKLNAGFYTLNAEVTVEDQTGSIEGSLEFAEKHIVTDTSNEFGFFVHTNTISKSNEGNVASEVQEVINKNIISRLFTSFSPDPDIVDRSLFKIKYTWEREIQPGEVLDIKVKTNWFYPFIIIILVIAIVVFIKRSTTGDLTLRKQVSFVRAKGGEFALKVTVNISSKSYVEKVRVIDRLPPLVKIYERFGAEKPTKIDEKNRRLEYNFQKLEAGEMRVISYIVYSKVGVLGKFALPSAVAIYEKEGEIKEEESNKAFFVAEQRTKDVENEY